MWWGKKNLSTENKVFSYDIVLLDAESLKLAHISHLATRIKCCSGC